GGSGRGGGAALERVAAGRPLALSMAAALVGAGAPVAAAGVPAAPGALVDHLAELFLEDVADPTTRRVLQAACLVRTVTAPPVEAMLPAVPPADPPPPPRSPRGRARAGGGPRRRPPPGRRRGSPPPRRPAPPPPARSRRPLRACARPTAAPQPLPSPGRCARRRARSSGARPPTSSTCSR